MAIWTVNRLELKFLTYSVRILIEALRTDASVSDRAKLGVQGALGTSSLEQELIAATAELANSTGIERKTSPAYASSIGDNLVECARVAISLGIDEFITLALADALRSRFNLASWANAF